MLFLSADFGTSAVKLSIVDQNLKVLCHAKREYPYILLPGEKSEISPDKLMDAFYAAASELDASMREKVEYLCYDTFSPSPVFMDDSGDLVYPNIITHLDRRSRKQSEYINGLIGKDSYMDISGIYPFPGGCSAMTLIWFLQNEPYVFERTKYIGHLPTYLHKKFTGEWMIDLVNASMTGLYETTTQSGWSDTLIERFGLNRQLFCDIYNPGLPLGTLLPDIARKLGVRAGIKVTVGTNDVAAAQMGAGNIKAGQIMNTAGSSEMVSILTDSPCVNPHYYLRNAALPGLWQIYSTTAGGFAIDWFYKEFCKDLSKEEFYDTYIVNSIKSCMDNKEVTFTPYLTGDRQSLEKKTASFLGLTLSSTREQMLSSMLRSMQGVLKTTIEEASLIQKLDTSIKISGGMVTASYMQLKKLEIPSFEFQVVDDCPILGNVELAKYYMTP